jgi:formylglycine-generating enzyme required for sulfatase activity
VTVGQFRRFADAERAAGSAIDPKPYDYQDISDDRAVAGISWRDAAAFCNWLSTQEGLVPYYADEPMPGPVENPTDGYRLPTEAEWEFACRAGTETHFSFGDDFKRVLEHVWCNGNNGRGSPLRGDGSGECPMPVGRRPANAFGLFDMHGNVSEYCQNWYEGGYGKYPATDPQGPAKGREVVLRGGWWNTWPASCRCAAREIVPSIDRNFGSSGGFRVVRTLRKVNR